MNGPSKIESFGLLNPSGPGMNDVPSLLRRMADALDKKEPLCVLDLSLTQYATGEGYQYGLRVFYTHDPRDVSTSRWHVDEDSDSDSASID